jgi:type II secretory pathway component PulF
MATFAYKAVTAGGETREGTVEAPGRMEAMRVLARQGLRPVRLGEGGVPAAARPRADAGLLRRRGGVTARDLERFTRQLSNLLAAGVPLSRALQILGREGARPAAAARWREVRDLVVDGAGLADAMGRFPQIFPRVYTAMVRAGETGGFLSLVLGQIAEFQARDKELRGKVVAALTYPAVLLVLTLAVMVFLLTFFIPRFEAMFNDLGAPLPLLTQAILATSRAITGYGPVILAALVGVGIMVARWLGSPAGRRAREQATLAAPVVGPLAARLAMTRFCRMLGTLVRSGVELITALRVARESLGNQVLVDTLGDAIERIRKGESLASALASCRSLFPGDVVEMIAVAEESGRLDAELVRLADESEKDLDGQLRTAVSLAEPLMLFIMAALIGTIFVGMVLPIFSIQDYIK